MTRTDWKGWGLVALVLGAAAWVALPDSRAEAAPSPRAQVADPGESLWWIEAGEQSAATLWLGPIALAASGLEVRRWALVAFLPGSDEPLSCLDGVVAADDVTRIYLKGASFHVEVEPIEGRAWRGVTAREHLAVDVGGFF